MKAMQVQEANGDFVLVDLPMPEPGAGEIRIKVEACGICHSDAFVKFGLFPGIEFPRVPGHEVAGVVDQVGDGVTAFKKGDRVGVGWHGGQCFQCDYCRRGDFINCDNGKICGISYDGGYQEYMVAPWEAAARIPDDMPAEEAGPLLCAGVTTFNSLRNSGARPGDTVAVSGIGGLGHLGVQYASRMGFRTVALSRGDAKRELAKELGAHVYIDTAKENVAEALQALGGADVILATAPNAKVISELTGGLSKRGKLLIVAAAGDNVEFAPMAMLSGKNIAGWPSGSAIDSEDTMNFSALTGVKPHIETFPLEKANEGFAKMMENQVRFRAVLKMG
jgi:D-arabinose 1-dehydrogenase-like Zn-dependent alcohol dehydrogenase